ncbi:deoxyuridine 5'-triphosphate nucleotidohydrolase [candidate division WWE3 bacterium]|uniref:dUTP diphosphatase n=1 Tax=candidate division WWE3 bacterium TaxID=2053526 RepID=A0A7X9DL33_UNCKA|nr:deoxyuridine 5'-triphosphate nucleotidohydrolase [candidate division WWE3 bacterium]
MNKFYKVSLEQYIKDANRGAAASEEYDRILLPRRATKLSAGYDFFAPFDFTLSPGEEIKFPTGIRVKLDEDKFLACFPRSGLGFKYKLQLANTVGIIDADYFSSPNEGHIHVKLCNNGDKVIEIHQGDAFMQGVILPFYKTDDDESTDIRTGGMGSTSR